MLQTPTMTPGVMLPHWCRTARRAPINTGRESPAMTKGRHGRPAPRRGLLPIKRYTRSGSFNPN